MPINELERHPFLNYHQLPQPSTIAYTGLVVGSFPIYAITDTVSVGQGETQQRFDSVQARMKFFYGSEDSDFWQYCSAAFGEAVNPAVAQPGDVANNGVGIARQRCIDFLDRHKLLMTDVIYQTNRVDERSEDKYLWQKAGVPEVIKTQLQLNHTLPALLDQYPTIRNLYFTATGQTGKCPFGWFKKIFVRHVTITNPVTFGDRSWSVVLTIQGRMYNAFFLPTPKARGVHFGDQRRAHQFVNYLQHQAPAFYEQIGPLLEADREPTQEAALTAYRLEFLAESYRQAMVSNNLHFDGVVPNP